MDNMINGIANLIKDYTNNFTQHIEVLFFPSEKYPLLKFYTASNKGTFKKAYYWIDEQWHPEEKTELLTERRLKND